jgi:probable HAF family extracellular repeat protein
MKRITILMVILCTCLASVAWAQGPHRYTVTDLGTLGGTYSQPSTAGLSNSGWVGGDAYLTGDTAYHAFLWKKRTGMIDLGTLGGPNSGTGYQVSDSAGAVGSAETSVPDPQGYDCLGMGTYLTCLPFRWQNGVMTALPTLGGHDGFGLGINNLGVAVGWSETSTPDPDCGGYRQSAVIWIKGQVYELPLFPGDWNGAARVINDNGQVAGWSGGCARLHALLWQNGTPIDLGSFGGTIDIAPFDINNQGQIVGYSYYPDNYTVHGFLWQKSTGMLDLGTLPGDVFSWGIGINSKGQTVGGSEDASYNERAYLWQNGVMTDLNTLIPPASPFYLLEADGINDAGQIAGYIWVYSTGEVHAFLATPTTAYGANSESPKVVLPDNVRTLLQQRRGGRFGVGPKGRQ